MIRSNRSSKWRAECIVAEIQSSLQTFCDYMHALGSLHWMFFVEFIDSVFVIVFFEKGQYTSYYVSLFSFSNNIFLLIKKKKGKINATIFAVHQAALQECQCLGNLAFKKFMSIFWICMTVVLARTLCSVILSFCCIKKKRDPFPVFHACILILISNFL